MALAHYQQISGVQGTFNINGVDYPAATWLYSTHASSIILRTASSMPLCDTRRGSKTLSIRASGPAKSNFNPFRQAIPPYLNTYVNITCIADNNTQANCPSALVVEWTYSNDADGYPIWIMEAIGNFLFQNMAQNNL